MTGMGHCWLRLDTICPDLIPCAYTNSGSWRHWITNECAIAVYLKRRDVSSLQHELQARCLRELWFLHKRCEVASSHSIIGLRLQPILFSIAWCVVTGIGEKSLDYCITATTYALSSTNRSWNRTLRSSYIIFWYNQLVLLQIQRDLAYENFLETIASLAHTQKCIKMNQVWAIRSRSTNDCSQSNLCSLWVREIKMFE